MDLKELRLGNYVMNGRVIIDFDEKDWDCIVNRVFSRTPEDRYHPIPLTKECLLKLGFVANKYNDEFELYPLVFDCEYTDKGEWNIRYEDHPLSTEIQHVHQLQNLYFALTGEELTLKN